jgi:hypothetical protein
MTTLPEVSLRKQKDQRVRFYHIKDDRQKSEPVWRRRG